MIDLCQRQALYFHLLLRNKNSKGHSVDKRFQVGTAFFLFLPPFASEQSVAQNKTRDPTFNGIVGEVQRCGIATWVGCADGYCTDLNPQGAVALDLALDFRNRVVTTWRKQNLTEKRANIEIVDVSEPLLNKPLWVRFKVRAETLSNAITPGFFMSKPITTYVLAPM